MKSNNPRPPTEAELDRLLGAHVRRTSPDFEQRWRELRGELAAPRRRTGVSWGGWLLWTSLPTLALASFALIFLFRQKPSTPAFPESLAFQELIALDSALEPARSLLNAENRDALLYLPSQPRG